MRNKILSFALLIAVFALGYAYVHNQAHPLQSISDGTYERVMRTNTFRCGYGIWPPFIAKDPATGQLSGIVYEYLEALGAALHVKIEWTEEVGWGDFPAALQSGRIDGMCAGIWPNASRARQVDFTQAILYNPIYAYARADDKRFDTDITRANKSEVTIATMDGEMSSLIAASDFPDAKQVQLPQLASGAELFTNVTTGKADLTFTDSMTGAQYNLSNPGKIRRVPTPIPVRVFANTIAIPKGEERLRRMLDTATDELLSSGKIDKILAKHEKEPGMLLHVTAPYVMPPQSN